jgi:hypothetical protein
MCQSASNTRTLRSPCLCAQINWFGALVTLYSVINRTDWCSGKVFRLASRICTIRMSAETKDLRGFMQALEDSVTKSQSNHQWCSTAASCCTSLTALISYSPSHVQTCIKILKFTFFLFVKLFFTSLLQYMFRPDMVIIRCFENYCWKLLHFRQWVQFQSTPSFMRPYVTVRL